MAKSTRTRRMREAAGTATSNPYVRRLIEDEELRDNLRHAFESARNAYHRVSNGRGPYHGLVEDRKVHKELRSAARSLREASDQLRGRRRGMPWGKLLLAGAVGFALAMILSEELRKALLDRLFGPEEEFEYTSTAAPETETTQA